MTFLTGTGRHRAQIIYFLWIQIGSQTPSGIGLGSGIRLRRMRRCLGLSRELWIQNFGGSPGPPPPLPEPATFTGIDGADVDLDVVEELPADVRVEVVRQLELWRSTRRSDRLL